MRVGISTAGTIVYNLPCLPVEELQETSTLQLPKGKNLEKLHT